jgi:hypothetical protein
MLFNATFKKFLSYIMAVSFKTGVPEKNTDKLYHRVYLAMSGIRTHAVLVIGLYEL